MNRRQFLKVSALLGVLSAASLAGCSSGGGEARVEESDGQTGETQVPAEEAEAAVEDDGITDEQRNSVNMYNYLATVTRGISESQNSRLLLEQVYSELINNIEPSTVDAATLTYIEGLLDSLEAFRMVAVKRDRLRYIYEKNRADAVMQAVPDPVGVLSAVASFDVKGLVTSVAYMAVDSATSYELAISEAESRYLEDGWELDDEAAAALHDMRQDLFGYMVQTANDYELPSGIMLNEEAVDNFVVWKAEKNVARRIQYLEDNEETYRSFGPYWLACADAYYENGSWAECLKAVDSYEALNVATFRYNCDYANVLPAAIASAEESLDDAACAERCAHYVEALVDNARKEDWALRYFAATTCIALHTRTGEADWLEKAYDLALENVNGLVGEQDERNGAYLAAVQKEEVPEGTAKDEREEIEAFNAMLEQERKTELPPVGRPLLANLTLLKALSDALDKDDASRAEVDRILFGDGGRIFLVDALDDCVAFAREATFDPGEVTVEFSGSEVRVPVRCVCDVSVVNVVVSGGDVDAHFDDWAIDRVERGTEGDLGTFVAVYRSEGARTFHFEPEMRVRLSVDAYPGQDVVPVERSFKAVNTKDAFYKYLFVWESNIGFVEE